MFVMLCCAFLASHYTYYSMLYHTKQHHNIIYYIVLCWCFSTALAHKGGKPRTWRAMLSGVLRLAAGVPLAVGLRRAARAPTHMLMHTYTMLAWWNARICVHGHIVLLVAEHGCYTLCRKHVPAVPSSCRASAPSTLLPGAYMSPLSCRGGLGHMHAYVCLHVHTH